MYPSDQNVSFEIHLVWSDRFLEVAANQTALEVLIAAGVPIEVGCQVGGCGDCATEYVEGDVLHFDACLDDGDRKRFFCPCVSRAMKRIVLPF